MAISVYPAPSNTGIEGAGSIAAKAYTTKGWYSTSLAAGSYIAVVIPAGGSTLNAIGTYTDPYTAMWSFSSYENSIKGHNLATKEPALFSLTSTDTVYFGLTTEASSSFANSMTFRFTGMNNYQSGGNWNANNSNGDNYIRVGHSNSTRVVSRVPFVGRGISPLSNTYTTSNTTFAAGSFPITSMGYYNNAWQVGDNQSITYRSTDLTTWTGTNIGFGQLQDMAWNGTSYYAAVGTNATENANIASSTDGITWALRTAVTGANAMRSITWGNNLWVAVGDLGTIVTSTDSITWSARTAPQVTFGYNRVIHNGTRFLAWQGGHDGSMTAATSTDGITWTAQLIAFSKAHATYSDNAFRRQLLLTSPGKYLVKGGDNITYAIYGNQLGISTDLLTWGWVDYSVTQGYWTPGQPVWHTTHGLINEVANDTGGRGTAWCYPVAANYTIYKNTFA